MEKWNLLIVEDEEHNVKKYKGLLEDCKYAPFLNVLPDVITRVEDFDTYMRQQNRVDIILLDLNLRGKYTDKCLAALKKQNQIKRPLVVIYVSSYSKDRLNIIGNINGGNLITRFLRKIFVSEELDELLEEVLGLLRQKSFPQSLWLPHGSDGKRKLDLAKLVFIRTKLNSITKSEVQIDGQPLMDWHCDFADIANELENYFASPKQLNRHLFYSKGRSSKSKKANSKGSDRRWIIHCPYLISHKPARKIRGRKLCVGWTNPRGGEEKQSFLMSHHYWSKEGGKEWVNKCV